MIAVVGLLAFRLKTKNRAGEKEGPTPYGKAATLLTPAERSFLGVLEQATWNS